MAMVVIRVFGLAVVILGLFGLSFWPWVFVSCMEDCRDCWWCLLQGCGFDCGCLVGSVAIPCFVVVSLLCFVCEVWVRGSSIDFII